MNMQPLLQADLAIQVHVAAAVAALGLGALVLFRRKGDVVHRIGGRMWVVLMAVVAVSSFFIHEIRLFGPWSPIHLVSIATLWFLVDGIRKARRGRIMAHRHTMKGVFFGGLIVAGGFTFIPGRMMHEVMLAETDPIWLALIAIGPLVVWLSWKSARRLAQS